VFFLRPCRLVVKVRLSSSAGFHVRRLRCWVLACVGLAAKSGVRDGSFSLFALLSFSVPGLHTKIDSGLFRVESGRGISFARIGGARYSHFLAITVRSRPCREHENFLSLSQEREKGEQ